MKQQLTRMTASAEHRVSPDLVDSQTSASNYSKSTGYRDSLLVQQHITCIETRMTQQSLLYLQILVT
ncbi:hypothetical protein D3C86_2223670 [compost metagenome]